MTRELPEGWEIIPGTNTARKTTNDTTPKTQRLPDPEPAQLPATLVGDSEGEARGTRCPHVCFTLRRVRLLDIDAKYGSIKDLLDGLQYAGIIHQDREGEITLEVRQEKVAKFKDEETLITVEL